MLPFTPVCERHECRCQLTRATGEAGAHGARQGAALQADKGPGRLSPWEDKARRRAARAERTPTPPGAIMGTADRQGGRPLPVRPFSEGGNAGAGPPGAALARGPGREARTPAQGRRRQAPFGCCPCPLEINSFPLPGGRARGRRRGKGGARGGRGIPPSARAELDDQQSKGIAGRHEGGHDQEGRRSQGRAPGCRAPAAQIDGCTPESVCKASGSRRAGGASRQKRRRAHAGGCMPLNLPGFGLVRL